MIDAHEAYERHHNLKVKHLKMKGAADNLAKALQKCILEMSACRVFVNSREKTKQPEGAEVYEKVLDEARTALAAYKEEREQTYDI